MILVWKFSRFTRKREHAVAFKSMLRRKGIRVVSITEYAGGSPTGKLMEAIIESVDEFYLFGDGACCLGLKYAAERNLTLERFVSELVIPFLYRLSYTDRYGLTAAREGLWGEYSHEVAGESEYQDEILQLAGKNTGRNQPCPCGLGLKYKRCHLDEVEAVKRIRPHW